MKKKVVLTVIALTCLPSLNVFTLDGAVDQSTYGGLDPKVRAT